MGKASRADLGRRMSDAEYLIDRAQQELNTAISALDARVRKMQLELTNAYYSGVGIINPAERCDARAAKPLDCFQEGDVRPPVPVQRPLSSSC